MLVDLHMHSFFSDGTMSPEEIVKKAKNNNVKIVSLTDHNCIDGWSRFEIEAKKEGLIPLKGVEINCIYKDKVLHLLAYNFENTPTLMNLIKKADMEMKEMSVDLIEKLSKSDSRVSLNDYYLYEYDNKKGGWKGLHYLFDRKITSKLFDGFKYYKDFGCDFIEYDFPNLEELCTAINDANGYSVLAHPFEYYKNLSKESLLSNLEALKINGIQGIECYYPTHNTLMTETCVEFCMKNNLLITSGSDEHGDFGKHAKTLDQTIGCMKISLDKLNLSNLVKC